MSRTPGGVLGVRTADGAVVPLLDFRLAASGRAIFTTTADGQRRAVFEFYFRAADASGWTYLDSLCLPRIPPARAGEPDLELRAGLDPRGDLVLHMHDPASSLPESFVLEAAELRRLLPRQPARSPRHLRLLLTALLLGAGLLVGGFTLLRDRGGKPASPAPDTTPTVAAPPAAAAPAALPEADPAKAAAADATPTTAPPASPSPLPTARHPIAWGDTLWRIAERYYGERDLYRELAESNSLGDPDRIVAGQTLLLPPALADRERKPPGE
jgi:LysM repeat protein